MMRRGPQGPWEQQEVGDGADAFTLRIDRLLMGNSDAGHLATAVATTEVLEAGYRSASSATCVAVSNR